LVQDEEIVVSRRDRPDPAGRPGEYLEPVRLSPSAHKELSGAAEAHRVPNSLALAVLVDAELADRAVGEAGLLMRRLKLRSDAVALLSAAQADYLDFLAGASAGEPLARRPRPGAGGPAMVPVRLLPFCDPSLLDVAVRRDLGEALRWERLAMRSGRTLVEWALRQALVATTNCG
jgi:hypothetical protein